MTTTITQRVREELLADLRATTRYAVALEAWVGHGGLQKAVVLTNLSQGGTFAVGDTPPLGAKVRLWFRVPTHEDVIELDAIVRWRTVHGVGLQFGSMRAREAYGLGLYLRQLRG